MRTIAAAAVAALACSCGSGSGSNDRVTPTCSPARTCTQGTDGGSTVTDAGAGRADSGLISDATSGSTDATADALDAFIPPTTFLPPMAGQPSFQPGQTFRGWGMSLAWEANDLYGSALVAANTPTPTDQSTYLDLLFGDPTQRQTLGLTAARYNIGGGENPDPHHFEDRSTFHMSPDAQMEGYLDGAGQAYNWTRDASQRQMLHEAKNRGADIFEAFSNSPPYWMTNSLCASGSYSAGTDNLPPSNYQAFADYLVTVVQHFHQVEGVTFESLEAFNEPDGAWWVAGNSQEGNYAAASTQNTMLPMLLQALAAAGLSTFVAGTDANNYDTMTSFLGSFDSAALAALTRVNTHSYNGTNPSALHQAVVDLKKPLWMSEVGCCFAGQGDGTDIWGGLYMADEARIGLRDLGAEVWMFWQPGWGLVNVNGGVAQLTKQYYALAQYSDFIRPGFQVIWSGADNMLAAYSGGAQRLVLVATNWSASQSDVDLTGFSGLPTTARTYLTTADTAVNLQSGSLPIDAHGHMVDSQPAQSITTYVIDDVRPVGGD